MKRGATAHFLFTAFVWLLVIGAGTLAALFYQHWSDEDRGRAAPVMQDLENEFKDKWDAALDACADTPTVDDYVNRAPWLYRLQFADRLRKVDETLRKKHPRIRLACDSFSGYCVFRSAEFHKGLSDRGVYIHLIDDKADYNKRIQALQSGETPLAVFTVDSLINNSALFDAPPGVVVMVIDESRGADAMVSYKDALGSVEALNRSDLKIVLTPDSPSETLARLVRLKCNLTEVPKECFIPADNAEDVYDRFKTADAGAHTAFVLWEPYVSRLLQEQPQAYKLIDTSDDRCKGYIVDILVVQKDFLEKNRRDVEGLVRAYLETEAAYEKAPGGMAGPVQTDSKQLAAAGKLSQELKSDEAEHVAHKIHWVNTRENYARFDLLAGAAAQDAEPLEDTVKKIADFLVKTKTISRGVRESLVDRQTCADLVTEGFGLGGPVSFTADGADLSDEAVKQLQVVVTSLKSLPDRSLQIQASRQETPPGDPTLAQKRADAVFNWLRDHGVEEKRLTRTVGAAGDGQVVFRFPKAPS